jgi:ABC-2 type transport system ATP-binding protein
LRDIAITHGIPKSRVDEVIDIAGIGEVSKKMPGGFSLGMSQRLSIAAALLADPQNLILDEPVNGLDAEGVKWVRDLCRWYAGQGRTVLLSSHLMSEVAQTADDLVIIGRGTILKTTTVAQFIAENSSDKIRLVTPDPQLAQNVLNTVQGVGVADDTANTTRKDAATLIVDGITVDSLSQVLAANQVPVYELALEQASLEEAYLKLTHDTVEYRSHLESVGPENNSTSDASDGDASDSGVSDSGVADGGVAGAEPSTDVEPSPAAEPAQAPVAMPMPFTGDQPSHPDQAAQPLQEVPAEPEDSETKGLDGSSADDVAATGLGGLVVPQIPDIDVPQLTLHLQEELPSPDQAGPDQAGPDRADSESEKEGE